jgi:cell division protein FtsN
MGRVLAVALAIALLGFGVPALHAKDKAPQQVCSSTVTQSCTPVQVQPSCATCPVDPKKIHEEEEARQKAEAKAEKEAEHAQHEAAEECERNQKKAAHLQHEAAEKQAKVNEASTCCRPEPVAEATPPEPETTIAIVEPIPAPEPAPAPRPVVTLPPPPEPIAQPEPPKELPRTASPMGLIGLIGLLSMSGSLAGWFRR